MKSKIDVKLILAFFGVAVFWGTTYLGIRVAVETVPAWYVTAIRQTIACLIILVILCLVLYLRKDLYILSFSGDSESINIEYQKNFLEKQTEKFSINLQSIKSVDFSSKSFLEPFHKISIRYTDENGLFDKTTFKTNDDNTFIELIYKLKKEILFGVFLKTE